MRKSKTAQTAPKAEKRSVVDFASIVAALERAGCEVISISEILREDSHPGSRTGVYSVKLIPCQKMVAPNP
jgi:hypothetical protein